MKALALRFIHQDNEGNEGLNKNKKHFLLLAFVTFVPFVLKRTAGRDFSSAFRLPFSAFEFADFRLRVLRLAAGGT